MHMTTYKSRAERKGGKENRHCVQLPLGLRKLDYSIIIQYTCASLHGCHVTTWSYPSSDAITSASIPSVVHSVHSPSSALPSTTPRPRCMFNNPSTIVPCTASRTTSVRWPEDEGVAPLVRIVRCRTESSVREQICICWLRLTTEISVD